MGFGRPQTGVVMISSEIGVIIVVVCVELFYALMDWKFDAFDAVSRCHIAGSQMSFGYHARLQRGPPRKYYSFDI